MQLQMILKLVIRYLILNTLFPFLLEYCDISSKDSRICPLSSTDSIIFEYWVPPKKVVDVDNENFYPFSPKMKRWYDEAYEEINCTAPRPRIETYGIYPKRFYKNVSEMLEVNNKSIDFCFIGGLMKDVRTYQNRHWILSFIEKHFGSDSYLQFTDNEVKVRYEIIGSFDYTLEKAGFVPTYVPYDQRNFFDAEYVIQCTLLLYSYILSHLFLFLDRYFSVMSRCKFCLTPAGDNMFSMRFYEVIYK